MPPLLPPLPLPPSPPPPLPPSLPPPLPLLPPFSQGSTGLLSSNDDFFAWINETIVGNLFQAPSTLSLTWISRYRYILPAPTRSQSTERHAANLRQRKAGSSPTHSRREFSLVFLRAFRPTCHDRHGRLSEINARTWRWQACTVADARTWRSQQHFRVHAL